MKKLRFKTKTVQTQRKRKGGEDEEEVPIEKGGKILEKKAKLYDEYRNGSRKESQEGLVDFVVKNYYDPIEKSESESEGEDQRVEVVDEFGRTRMMPKSQAKQYLSSSSSEGYESSSSSNYEEQQRSPSPVNIHYDDSKEIRTKGTGYYKLSLDEQERNRQLQELNHQNQLAKEQQELLQKRREDRKRQLHERLLRIKRT